MIVSPSLLSCDFLHLQEQLDLFKGQSDLWFHLDIMDGHFVPNLTIGTPVINKLQKATDLPLDAHFMVTNPEFYVEFWKDFGLHNFTFHWEACHHHDRLIAQIKQYYKSAGVSLNPSTDQSCIPDYLLKQIDLVLVMSVNPGFGGQSFIEGAFDKIKALAKRRKELGAHFQIQVDGGVSDKNCKELIAAGADNLVAGSYIFKDPEQVLAKVQSLRG